MNLAILFTAHWLGDFVLQTDAMAQGKSKSNAWLTKHVLTYGALMTVVGILIGHPWIGSINATAHWVTDYFTSRWTSKLYQAGKRHDFFVVIGLDQLLHALVLIWSLSV